MKSIQIVGPFASNYSLARVNRGLAKALSEVTEDYSVSLTFENSANEDSLQNYPYLQNLQSQGDIQSDFVIYNSFPKGGIVEHGLANLPGKIKMAYFAWEETVYPEIWVKEINENLHALLVSATFVRDIMRNAGVKIPIFVVHNAIDDDVRNLESTGEYPLKTKKKVKFLNISTGRQRKGMDVLLKSYFNAFTKEDDVCLVLKSFPGPDNMINQLLAELETEDTPEVEHILNPDLTEQDLVNLITTCDVGVYPTRAEGFGLPIAESMYRARPVIATNYSAYLDFTNKDNSYLIDYDLVEAKDSEMVNIGAKWAEPDEDQLANTMLKLYQIITTQESTNEKQELKDKIRKAKESAEALSWQNSAQKILDILPQVEKIAGFKNQKAAAISFLNNEDGIAIYTKNLYTPVESSFNEFYYLSNSDIADRVEQDAENVVRNWESGTKDFSQMHEWLKENDIDIVHIQYHSGVNFSPEVLNQLLIDLSAANVETYLTLHAVRNTDFDLSLDLPDMEKAQKVFIHHKGDAEYLSEKFDNVVYYPLPRVEFRNRDSSKLKKSFGLNKFENIVCTHGLFNQNKNIPTMIEAFSIFQKEYPNSLFLGLNAVSSNNISAQAEYEEALKIIENRNLQENVLFVTDFLSNEQVEILVQTADINILAYKESGESASAAVDKFLASGNPTIVSNVKAFDVFKSEVVKVEPTSENIAGAIKDIVNNKEKARKLSKAALEFTKENSFEVKSVEMLEIYSANG
jgi:glycosyltransferase involved in cell wall biosynthesis